MSALIGNGRPSVVWSIAAEKRKIETMARLRRYVEWMNRSRRTDRVAYVTKEWNLPKPLAGAEWQLDTRFKLADELVRDPDLKTIVKAAHEKGAEVVIQRLSLPDFGMASVAHLRETLGPRKKPF